MYREKLHYIDIYKMYFMVIDSDDHDKVNSKHSLTYGDNTGASAHLSNIKIGKKSIYPYGKQCIFIRMNSNEKRLDCIPAAIAHECVHAAHFIMYTRDIKPDIDNDEAFAYLVEYLYELVYKFMKSKL